MYAIRNAKKIGDRTPRREYSNSPVNPTAMSTTIQRGITPSRDAAMVEVLARLAGSRPGKSEVMVFGVAGFAHPQGLHLGFEVGESKRMTVGARRLELRTPAV